MTQKRIVVKLDHIYPKIKRASDIATSLLAVGRSVVTVFGGEFVVFLGDPKGSLFLRKHAWEKRQGVQIL